MSIAKVLRANRGSIIGVSIILALLGAAYYALVVPSDVERALSRAPYPLQGHSVVCWEPNNSHQLRLCKVTLPDGYVDEQVLISATEDAFPESYAIYPDGRNAKVGTQFTGEEMDLATAQARLTADVRAAVAKATERQGARLMAEQKATALKKVAHLNRATYN